MDKKIKPTDEMVNEAAHALALHATGMALRFQDDLEVRAYRNNCLLYTSPSPRDRG